MRSAITQLESEIWNSCVRQLAARDEETARRWQTDEFAHLNERFLVQPLPAELEPLVSQAVMQWQQIEQQVCSKLGMTSEQFLHSFEKARHDFISGGKKWEPIIGAMQEGVAGAVRNMDWVNLFSWVLPKAVREPGGQNLSVGRMVTAIFYCELLSKYGKRDENGYLRKIEARWRFVNELT